MAKHGFLYLKAMLYVWATTSLTVYGSVVDKSGFSVILGSVGFSVVIEFQYGFFKRVVARE